MFTVVVLLAYTFAWSQFTEVKTYPNACIYARLAPFSDSIISNETFQECSDLCEYDSNCNFFSYYPDNCIRAVQMELTDNYNASKLYQERNTTTFMKLKTNIRYYSQLCVNYFNKRSCNESKNCAWRRGPIPFNIESYTTKNGWCSRIRC